MNIKTASLKKNEEKETLLAHEIAAYLSEKKAKDIKIIDISKKTPIADYFVICSAKSTLAVRALTDYVDEKLSKKGMEPKGRDIDPKWAAIDYGSVILHVFHEETREFYRLESLWDTGDNIESIEV